MNLGNRNLIFLFAIFSQIGFTQITYSQTDSSFTENNKLNVNFSLHSIQIDALLLLFGYEAGGQIDVDIFQTTDEKICLGTRMSLEHYSLGSLGGNTSGSPFNNYNVLARLSNNLGYLSFSVLGGITYYTTDDPEYLPTKYLVRLGFEAKLSELESIVGIVLKGSTSLTKNSGFIGIGISLGYYH